VAGSTPGGAGGANTGGGGGGATHNSSTGSAGGSGIVIVRYYGAQKATGGSITSSGGYTIHTFTTSGTFTPTEFIGAKDLSERNNTLTVNGAAWIPNDGGAYSLNGSSDIRTPLFSNAQTNVTMNGWFYVNLGTTGTFMSNGDDPGGYCIGIGTYFNTGDNRVTALFGYIRWILTDTYYGYTGWHMVTMSLDASGTPFIYINAVFAGSYPGQIANAPSAGGGFALGSHWGIRYSLARIGNASFYNRQLTNDEILQIFQAGRGRFGI
jgi:hypothetical protein